jgi:hypothetical protein
VNRPGRRAGGRAFNASMDAYRETVRHCVNR